MSDPGSVKVAEQLSDHTQSGLSENVAALLSYLVGWVTGVIFLLVDKRPFVRFHAAQSIVVFGGLTIVRFALGVMFGAGWWFGAMQGWAGLTIGVPLLSLVSLLGLILWILLMIKAYQGVRFKLPIAGEIAERISGR